MSACRRSQARLRGDVERQRLAAREAEGPHDEGDERDGGARHDDGKLEQLTEGCERVARQIEHRLAGEKINDRIVSLADTDARPIRKGKLGKPNEFGYVAQIAEVTANTPRGAPGATCCRSRPHPANAGENTLLPATVTELDQLPHKPREVTLDGGLGHLKSAEQLAPIAPNEATSRPPRTRLAPNKETTSALPHRSRRPNQPPQTQLRPAPITPQRPRRPADLDRLAILAYNLDTLAITT